MDRGGFTIVELLTVMAVIAILIGLLVPALYQVREYANEIEQKAQFHSIDVALEMFKTEFGAYPESSDNFDPFDATKNHALDPIPYCGANKLAEALVGLDYLGFHPNSDFRSDGINTLVDKTGQTVVNTYRVYHADTDFSPNWETIDENIKARKGPFIEFENANAFRMDEIYPQASLTTIGFQPRFITTNSPDPFYPLALCDVYAKSRSGVGSKKTGMPILYYRARTNYTQQRYNNPPIGSLPGGIRDDIYYYPDNENLLELQSPDDITILHPLADTGGSGAANDLVDFEDLILNRQVQTIQRPYRAGSYILISAGQDGLYGTADDQFNFEKNIE